MERQLLLSINCGSSLYTSFVQQTIVCQRVLNIGMESKAVLFVQTIGHWQLGGAREGWKVNIIHAYGGSCTIYTYKANTFKAMHAWPAGDPQQPSCMCAV